MHFLLPLEKGGWEGFEKLSLFKLNFQIHLNPPFLKEEEKSIGAWDFIENLTLGFWI